MKDNIQKLQQETLSDIASADSTNALEAIQQRVLGRKEGLLTNMLKGLKDLSVEEKREIGPLANAARKAIEEALEHKMSSLKGVEEAENFDVSLPAIEPARGTQHPMTHVLGDLVKIFREMGFMVYEGPELDSEIYNFEALNIPETHPARDIQDTFFIKTPIERRGEKRDLSQNKWVMRTQTSNMQVRIMEEFGWPVRCVIPGRVFRNEATDVTHDHTFYQLEGFVVDEDITIGQLMWFLTETLKQYFQTDLTVRLRPGYFPFVEPGYEIDLSCVFCEQKGCSICKHTGWIEIGGSGMIHPEVLRAAGIHPAEVSGFAFGLGVSRIPMLKYGIDDIRRLHANDISLLKQF